MESENTMPGSDLSTSGLTQAQRDAIGTLYRAFNTGESNLLDAVLVENWQDLPLAPGQEPGRDGVKPMVAAFRAAFADVAFTPQEVILCDGRAAVRLTLSGRHVGEWMGVPATGRSFEIAMHEMHHFEGDRITHTWHLEDWSGWREQIGAAGQA